jgi:hypothetical protein
MSWMSSANYTGHLCGRCHQPSPTGSGHKHMTDCVQACLDQIVKLKGQVADLRAVCLESNAVCLCGCPDSEHERYDDGEGCGHDDHECVRASVTVADMIFAGRRHVQELLRENHRIVESHGHDL